jgi:hypothetical protein
MSEEPRSTGLFDTGGCYIIDEQDTLLVNVGPDKGTSHQVLWRDGPYLGLERLTQELITRLQLEIIGSLEYILPEERESENGTEGTG